MFHIIFKRQFKTEPLAGKRIVKCQTASVKCLSFACIVFFASIQFIWNQRMRKMCKMCTNLMGSSGMKNALNQRGFVAKTLSNPIFRDCILPIAGNDPPKTVILFLKRQVNNSVIFLTNPEHTAKYRFSIECSWTCFEISPCANPCFAQSISPLVNISSLVTAWGTRFSLFRSIRYPLTRFIIVSWSFEGPGTLDIPAGLSSNSQFSSS